MFPHDPMTDLEGPGIPQKRHVRNFLSSPLILLIIPVGFFKSRAHYCNYLTVLSLFLLRLQLFGMNNCLRFGRNRGVPAGDESSRSSGATISWKKRIFSSF
jgi:hypothetical protein